MEHEEIPTAQDELHFPITMGPPPADAASIFSRTSFKTFQFPTAQEVPLTAEDRAWVVAKAKNPTADIPAPSFAAQRALQRQLDQFDFVVPGSQDQWQSYVMYKYFELSLDPDPKISKPALDALAKTSIVGLSVEKQEINIIHKSTEELEMSLKKAMEKYIGRSIEGTAVRV